MRSSQRILAAFFVILLVSRVAAAQLTTAEEKGVPSNSTFMGGDVDIVNLQNGNLHISIPIYTSTQRGGKKLSWSLMYDSQSWVKQWQANNCGPFHCNPLGYYVVIPHPTVVSGWRFSDPTDWEISNSNSGGSTSELICPGTGNPYGAITNWTVIDPEGSQHALPLRQETDYGCNGQQLSGPALDGSGIFYDSVANVFYLKDGTQIGNGEIRDTNGNLYTFANAMDTNGRTPVTVTSGPNVAFTTPMGAHLINAQYTLYTVLDAQGHPQTYRVDYQAVDFTSNSCGWTISPPGQTSPYSCTEDYQPMIEPAKVTLPDLRAYVFTFNNNSPGELSRLDLPTGASVSYTYTDFFQTQVAHGLQTSYAGARAVTTRTVTSDGVTQPWTYALNNSAMQTVVTDPVGNVTTHNFNTVSAGSGGGQRLSANRFEVSTVYADAAGHTLRTVNTDYTAEVDPVNNTTANVRPIRKTTTLENGQVTKKETDYETFSYICACGSNSGTATRMNPTEERVYDYGSGSPGALLQRTDYTYLHNVNTAYAALNIVNKPYTVIIYDGASHMAAQTKYEYDVYTHPNQNMMPSNAIQHDSSFGTSYTMRGNRTASSKWRSTDGALLTTTNQYDDAGNVLSSIDPLGHPTYYSYVDGWGTNPACVPTGQTAAFPTKVTNAKGQSTSSTYNACTGSVSSTTDLNSKTTSYSYDFMGRPKQVLYPDGGAKTMCYSDDPNGLCYSATALSSQETDAISTSSSLATTTLYDSLGRVKESQVTSDPDGVVSVDTQYDLDGRAYKTSNPYRSSDTKYWTTNTYDGIGRILYVYKADGSKTSTTYTGNTTTITDEATHQRKSQTNGLGQLTYVWEDPGGLNYETDYLYDVLGNMLQATQKGGNPNSANWRVRTFTYNSLSQLLCSANPEIGSPSAAVATCPVTDTGSYIPGTVRYGYDIDGEMITKTAPLENQTTASTVTTTMTYDMLHRLTGKTYTDNTPSVSYTYDGDTPPCTVPTITQLNLVGHMRAMCDSSGATAWSYDVMGRTLTEGRTIGGVSDQIGYTYYVNGSVSTVTYPKSGAATPFVMTYHENAAGRTDTATGSDGVVYGQVTSTWASGAPNVWQLGSGVQLTETYNSRLQPLVTTATQISSVNTLFSRSYNFGAGTNDNGNLYGVTDGLDSLDIPGRPHGSVNYTYDVLNRIASANTLGTDCTAVNGGTRDWASSYTVDAWGNLTAKTPTQCQGDAMPQAGLPVITTNNRNRLSNATYDSAGNITQEYGTGYQYDAEGRLISGSGSAYTYDGMGERVAKPGKLYWKGVGSTALVETDTNDLNPTKYIFFNGARIARIDPGTTAAKYYVTDNIGSTALVTDASGNVLNESLFFPYGVERVITQNDTANNYKFSGKERDSETGLDDFGARYYDSALGRFMTPDWDAKAAAVPYAAFGDPQTLNLYAYVENGPLNKVDADGHVSGESETTDYGEEFGSSSLGDGFNCIKRDCMAIDHMIDDAIKDSVEETASGQADPSKPQVEQWPRANGAQQNAGPLESHLTPTPPGTKCDAIGVICENGGKSVRVGDYDGEVYCHDGKCQKWNSVTNRWDDAPSNQKGFPNGRVQAISKPCAVLANAVGTSGNWAKSDAKVAAGIGTYVLLTPQGKLGAPIAAEVASVFAASAAVEQLFNWVGGAAYSGAGCPASSSSTIP